jgi:hypothetical protein
VECLHVNPDNELSGPPVSDKSMQASRYSIQEIKSNMRYPRNSSRLLFSHCSARR